MISQARKVLFFVPQLKFGGVSSVFLRLAEGLGRAGVDVTVAIGDGDEELVCQLRSFDNVSLRELKCKRARHAVFRLREIIRVNDFRVVVGVQAHGAWCLVVAAALALRKVDVLSWEHTTPSKSLAFSSRFTKTLFLVFAKLMYLNMAKVVAVSEGVRADIIDYYRLAPDKVIALRSPIYSVADTPPAPRRSNSGETRFLSLGRLSVEKGLAELLGAFSKLPADARWVLVIVGDGEERPRLEAIVSRDELLRQRVKFAGFTTEPGAWYQSADVFVLSSFYEGLPTVLVEASLHGLPLISTDCESGPREIIASGVNGLLVPVGDTDAMSQALLKMLESHSDFRNGVEYVVGYSAEEAVGRFVRLLESPLG